MVSYELQPGEERSFEFELTLTTLRDEAASVEKVEIDDDGLGEDNDIELDDDFEADDDLKKGPLVKEVKLYLPRSGEGVGRRQAAISFPVDQEPAHHQQNNPLLPSDVGGRPRNWDHEEYYGKP